jgi:hypothetical protein
LEISRHGLDLADPGFNHSVLSEFRTRLICGHSEHLLFETLLTQLREHGYLKEGGRQRSDSTHILAMVHAQSLRGMRWGDLLWDRSAWADAG